jgi:2-hydroxychromene-2-carboxylate isomerase
VLKDLCVQGGIALSPDAFIKRLSDQDVKDRLIANTSELIDRGGFGSPTMFVGTEVSAAW